MRLEIAETLFKQGKYAPIKTHLSRVSNFPDVVDWR
jgi:hypothetical protein